MYSFIDFEQIKNNFHAFLYIWWVDEVHDDISTPVTSDG